MWTTLKKIHKIKLDSMVITWHAIGSWFSFTATSMTCDILSFKGTHLISPTKDVGQNSLQEIPFYKTSKEITMFSSPSRNSCHESNTSNPNLPSHFRNMDFCISSNHCVAAQSVQRHMLDDLGFNCCIEPLLLLY